MQFPCSERDKKNVRFVAKEHWYNSGLETLPPRFPNAIVFFSAAAKWVSVFALAVSLGRRVTGQRARGSVGFGSGIRRRPWHGKRIKRRGKCWMRHVRGKWGCRSLVRLYTVFGRRHLCKGAAFIVAPTKYVACRVLPTCP